MRKRLHDLADVHYGESPKAVLDPDGSIPVIGTGGTYATANKSLFCGSAIVVPRKGSLGNPQLLEKPFWPADTTYAVVPKTGVDAGWLYYNLDRFDLTRLNEATGVPSISRDWLYQIGFNDPGPDAQRRIARILRIADDSIQISEALISKYQLIKAGLMHDLFTRGLDASGQLRPPQNEAPELYKDSALGWIPNSWKSVKLGSILNEVGGYLQTGPFGSQLHAHEYANEGVPVVMPQDIENGAIITRAIAKISERRARMLGRHQLRRGDVIIARRGDLDRAAPIADYQAGWVCGTGCFLVRLKGEPIFARFLSYVYRHDHIQRQIRGRAVGTTMRSLNNKVMDNLLFPDVDKAEQELICKRIEAVENHLASLKLHLAKLSQQRFGLMDDLLSGKVKVTLDEPAHV